ncbi:MULTISPECIES: hypothetical protein [unclassified Micromonospora]|uniref:hypothetical protein n=1 Tax=unclassified Micromonospora TaxID=2617518 RepID=UPI00331C94E2
MTTSSTARRHPAAGPNPRENGTVNDNDLHHLFDLIRDDKVRFANWRHTDTGGVDIDDLVYAAEAKGLITVYPNGVLKPTGKGRAWRDRNHRPGPVNVVFSQAEVA